MLAGLMLLKALVLGAVVAGATLDSLRPYVPISGVPALNALIRSEPAAGPVLLLSSSCWWWRRSASSPAGGPGGCSRWW